MITARLFWHDYRYFPYERDLAKREVEAVSQEEIQESIDGLIIRLPNEKADMLKRLTYFKGIEVSTQIVVPDQAKIEASALTNGQTWIPEKDVFPSLRRQSTRYSAHGLHEYRGKFNPQVVRAIGNLIGLEPGSWVLDPFCGSGTTLLEAAHIGWNALAFDANPLGVMIANAKVAAFKASPAELEKQSIALVRSIKQTDGSDWKTYLPNSTYLDQWFTSAVLEELTCILKAVDQTVDLALRPMFRVILSNICRDVSLQDPGDLRIRRRKEPYPKFDTIGDFSTALQAKVETIRRARGYLKPNKARQLAILADSRFSNEEANCFLQASRRRFVDAAITSPPYATALPYVDTQRLSLCLLGLIPASGIRAAERSLIGNREIGDAERLALEEDLRGNSARLPDGVARFCVRLLEAADHADHGFRRRNVPGLVYKYFSEMSETFRAVRNLVRRGGSYALVIGSNKTNLQGEEIVIDTPSLLGDLAESCGWNIAQVIDLDTYHRYDVHQKNSIRSEVLLLLRNGPVG